MTSELYAAGVRPWMTNASVDPRQIQAQPIHQSFPQLLCNSGANTMTEAALQPFYFP